MVAIGRGRLVAIGSDVNAGFSCDLSCEMIGKEGLSD